MEPLLTVLASGPGYEGFLVLDSLQRDSSSGGVRISPDLSLEEIRSLAREMTLKLSLFRLPRGGAKSGLRLDPGLDAEARRRALLGFGRQLGPIIRAGLYHPGTDMNCGYEELSLIYAGAGLRIGRTTDTAFFTAIGVARAIEGCADALGLAAPATIAIEGFGSVATHLAGMLPSERFSIRAISTIEGAIADPRGFDPAALKEARARHGNALVVHLPGSALPLEDLLTFPADILVPAARTGAISAEVAREVRARAVIPAANAPYAARAEAILHDRGVLCLPGCLCNAGGVFGSSLADSGVPVARVERLFTERFRPLVRHLVEGCLRRGVSPVPIVEEVAAREAERRADGGGTAARAGLPARVLRRLGRILIRRLPRSFRAGAVWRQALRTFDAMDADFREV